MSRDKQIEEMAKDVQEALKHNSAVDAIRHGLICVNSDGVARELFDDGYRKASEIVEEIEKYILEGVATIKSDNSDAMYGVKFAIESVVLPILEAFKKKYTEEGK